MFSPWRSPAISKTIEQNAGGDEGRHGWQMGGWKFSRKKRVKMERDRRNPHLAGTDIVLQKSEAFLVLLIFGKLQKSLGMAAGWHRARTAEGLPVSLWVAQLRAGSQSEGAQLRAGTGFRTAACWCQEWGYTAAGCCGLAQGSHNCPPEPRVMLQQLRTDAVMCPLLLNCS